MTKEFPYKNIGLDPEEELALTELLQEASHNPPQVEDIWELMDKVWDQYGCSNLKLDPEKITSFYKHPIWTLNGLFIEQDPISLQHRHAISDWIAENKIKNVLDYGGGFGTLARMISKKDSTTLVDIFEPHPSNLAQKKINAYPNINLVSSLNKNYDCLVSTDVLEHVPDPLSLLGAMIQSVKPHGFLIIANNFYPVIKCHLPSTFHFRYSFNFIAKLMGLRSLGICHKSHATIYQKTSDQFSWSQVHFFERLSSFVFPALTLANRCYTNIKKQLK